MLLMSDYELADSITRLEKCWKSAAFGDTQRVIISRHMKQLSVYEANKMIEMFAMTRKYPPLPIDVAEAVKDTIKKRQAHEVVIEPSREVECQDCMETGFNFVEVDQHEVLIACRCPYGSPLDAIGIPNLKGDMKLLNFPSHLFAPAKGIEGRDERIAWWKAKKQISFEYWGVK